jgi:hypothetical protein
MVDGFGLAMVFKFPLLSSLAPAHYYETVVAASFLYIRSETILKKLARDLSRLCGFFVSDPFCLTFSSAFHYSDYSFCVHHPVSGISSISLHMQWPLTSQLHGSFLKENNWFLS